MGTKLGMGSLVLEQSILVDRVCVPLFQGRKWWLRATKKLNQEHSFVEIHFIWQILFLA